MPVKRIVSNIAANDIEPAKQFYSEVLGLRVFMDHGWIVTFAGDGAAAPQIGIATEGGSGAPVPDISIEVDNLQDVHRRVLAARFAVEYGPQLEPWGVARFYGRDPFGRLINILSHQE